MSQTLLNVLGIVVKGLVKAFPFLAAFFAGKKDVESKVVEASVEERQEGDIAANEAKQSVRKKGVAEHVRKNKI